MFLSKGNLILECPFGAFKYSKKTGGALKNKGTIPVLRQQNKKNQVSD